MIESFQDVVVKLMENNSIIVLIECDLGRSSGTASLRNICPDRYFNVGVAEAGAAGLACGLARVGWIPIVHSFAAFLTGRAFEFIKLGAGYHSSNVLFCGTRGGLENALSGPTHHACEDFALMSSIPGLSIHAPPDFPSLYQLMKSSIAIGGPHYFRVPGRGTESLRWLPDVNVGDVLLQCRGEEPLILYTGTLGEVASKVKSAFNANGWQPTVACVPTLSAHIHPQLSALLRMHKNVISMEEHFHEGGLITLVNNLRPDSCRAIGAALPKAFFCEAVEHRQLLTSEIFGPNRIQEMIDFVESK